MSCVAVLNQNYISEELLVEQTESSELAAAPATNVYDMTRRTRLWRTRGHWYITSANKGIVFRESVGVNLTANIAEATYTSTSSFLTAIKTALDAAGDSTYTVTQDSTTGKIKITSNGSGGGGIFQLMWTNVASTAASVLGFSTSVDDTGALNYTADLLRIHTSEWLRWDLGVASNPKAFALIGLRNEGIQLSESAVVKLQGNSTDAWTAPEFEQTMTWNEESICAFSETGLHTQGLRYWRLLIEDKNNVDGYIEISGVYLGDMFVSDRGAVQFPLDIEHIDLSSVTYSEEGVSFGDVRQQTEQISLDWFGLTTEEKEELEDFVLVFGRSYPFYIALDPNGVFSSSPGLATKLVKFSENPRFKLISPDNWGSSWVLREEV